MGHAPWSTHPWVAEGQGRVRFGVFGGAGPRSDWPAFRDRLQLVEALGFDSYWLTDHPLDHTSACWTLLAAAAGVTSRIRLGSLVNCVYYCPPALLARMVADVDRFSGGRAILGLGIGHHEAEFRKLGLPFPPPSTRLAALEEYVQIVQGLWGATPFTLEGEAFQVRDATLNAGPVQTPRVPLVIAGGGERVTLRLVAHYGDAANFSPRLSHGGAVSLADVQRKCAALDGHCRALNRPPESVLRTTMMVTVVAETEAEVDRQLSAYGAPDQLRADPWFIAGTPAAVMPRFQALIGAGVQYFMLTPVEDQARTLQLLAEQVIPALERP